MPRRLCSGNQMVAEGALAAGCRFFAGYPITPASEIYEVMMRELPAQGGLALSAPDEISSLCYCVGASLRGLKAMTATSGPGWALMIETLQYALMTETPLVVALVQRLGPSTGGAPQSAQGGGRPAGGGAPRGHPPAGLRGDKAVAMPCGAVDLGALPDAPVWPRQSPPFAPVGGPRKVTLTGSAHNKDGWLRQNDPGTLAVLRPLEAKVAAREAGLGVLPGGPAP